MSLTLIKRIQQVRRRCSLNLFLEQAGRVIGYHTKRVGDEEAPRRLGSKMEGSAGVG